MRVNDKINNHQVLNEDDIKNIVNDMLFKMNFNKKNILRFDNKCKDGYEIDFMVYDYLEDEILINNSYKNIILKGIVDSALVNIKKNKNNNMFVRDSYNLELLASLYHELRHLLQYDFMFENKSYNFLIKVSSEYMILNESFYKNKHSQFLSEYDAEISAYTYLLDKIEKDFYGLSDTSIYNLNANIAHFLLKSRGYKIDDDDNLVRDSIFKSPLHMLSYLTKSWYQNNSKYKNYYNKTINALENVRRSVSTQFKKLMIGDNLCDEIINELYLISLGKIKIKNIFKYLENKLSKEESKCLTKKIQN